MKLLFLDRPLALDALGGKGIQQVDHPNSEPVFEDRVTAPLAGRLVKAELATGRTVMGVGTYIPSRGVSGSAA
jgi:hypothetical protein